MAAGASHRCNFTPGLPPEEFIRYHMRPVPRKKRISVRYMRNGENDSADLGENGSFMKERRRMYLGGRVKRRRDRLNRYGSV